jgi:hypothetical protein
MSDDFRRLEEVRSRLRSRRRRRLGAAAITTGAAALAAVSALPAPTVTGFLLSRSGRPVAPVSLSVSLVDDVRGQVTGWVKAVAPESGIIRVSSGAFGLRSLALVVTPETIIIVGDKEGGFGDIREGARVEAAYAGHPGGLRARRVEVFADAPDTPASRLPSSR